MLGEICEGRFIAGYWNDLEAKYREVDVPCGDAGSTSKLLTVRTESVGAGRHDGYITVRGAI